MLNSDNKKSGSGTTVGATSLELITIPIEGVQGVLIDATALGIDRSNTANSVTYTVSQGGGINLGVITLLPTLFGGAQKSLALLTANVTVTVSAGFMVMTVTGVAGKTIDWVGNLELLTM